jgi:hypothetical protein
MLVQDEPGSSPIRTHVHIPFRELVERIQVKEPLEQTFVVRMGDAGRIVKRFSTAEGSYGVLCCKENKARRQG